MLKLNINNSAVNFDEAQQELEKIKNVPLPDFARFETDFKEIKRVACNYQHYRNIIVVGNGGAINSFRGFYSCLAKDKINRRVEILNTVEPDKIKELQQTLPREKTLLIVISKSGTNPTALELLFAFWNYPKVIVCTEGLGALYQIVKREKLDYLKYPSHQEYPYLDDRHTGISASGLVPAALVGINVEEIYAGAKEMYRRCSPAVPIQENPALQLAATFYLLEKKNFEQIFAPIYSTKLYGFLPLIIQMLHETICKEGQGQTIFGDLAPESQHHTNQRFFGGKSNVLGFFITAGQEDQHSKVEIPVELTDIGLRGSILNDLNEVPYAKLLDFEFEGTFQDAVEKKIPVIQLELKEISSSSIGQFLAFFQYVAIYSAYLRGVNPLGQPQVERSKEISFELVKGYSSHV